MNRLFMLISTLEVQQVAIDTDTEISEKGIRQYLWGRIWNAITYAMLAVSIVVCVADVDVSWQLKVAAAGLSGLWGLWYWLFVIRSRFLKRRLPVQVFSFMLSILVAAAMSRINPVFVVLLFAYFGISFRVLPAKWAIPNVVLASTALAVRYMSFGDGWFSINNLLFLLGFLTMAFIASILGLFVGSITRQSHERQRMIKELESAQSELAKAEREAGVLEERQRLAGEIHDTLAQGFTSIILQLETAELALNSNPDEARQHLEKALKAARDSLGEARSALWALRPEILEREAIGAALGRTARNWEEFTGIRAHVKISDEKEQLPTEVEIALLRAAQEALANVHKHARASLVTLTLSYMGDVVILDVQDDGKGLAAAGAAEQDGLISEGYGLPAMRERVEHLGGRISVESSLGEGTTLVVEIPLPRSVREENI